MTPELHATGRPVVSAPCGVDGELGFESSNFYVDHLFGDHADRSLAGGVEAEQPGLALLNPNQHRERVEDGPRVRERLSVHGHHLAGGNDAVPRLHDVPRFKRELIKLVQRELALLFERASHRLGEGPADGVVGGTRRGVSEFVGDLLICSAADPQFRRLGVASFRFLVPHVATLQFSSSVLKNGDDQGVLECLEAFSSDQIPPLPGYALNFGSQVRRDCRGRASVIKLALCCSMRSSPRTGFAGRASWSTPIWRTPLTMDRPVRPRALRLF